MTHPPDIPTLRRLVKETAGAPPGLDDVLAAVQRYGTAKLVFQEHRCHLKKYLQFAQTQAQQYQKTRGKHAQSRAQKFSIISRILSEASQFNRGKI